MATPVIHLVYPDGPAISCPDAIGRKVREALSTSQVVRVHDWGSREQIEPNPGDCLIGHPHPDPRTVFRRSALSRGWRRIIMMCPYAHGDLRQVAMWDTVLPRCDAFLAITGNYWIQDMPNSLFAHWLPKVVHLDLAVDRGDFPALKRRFNPPGQRRFLYIGNKDWVKNTGYLSVIAEHMPGADFGWMGSGRGGIRGLKTLGRQDFSSAAARERVAGYDFMVTAGFSDANPATILEAMAWGLIPVCTPQSGYAGYPSIANIPLNEPEKAAAILHGMQEVPESTLLEWQAQNWRLLDDHFNWPRFVRQVREALESSASPRIDPAPLRQRLQIHRAALASPYVPWHPRQVARSIARTARNILSGKP
jgi:glycosyltransferase involved in cell wall biosynthesis